MLDMNKVSKIPVEGGQVGVFDIVLATDTDHNLTENKPYVVRELNGIDLLTVENDKGETDIYCTEWFKRYDSEKYGALPW